MSKFPAILKNPELDESLANDGYVVVPFLNAAEVRDLVDFFYEKKPNQIEGLYASAHSPDACLRVELHEKIKETFSRAIEAYFKNYKPLGGTFLAIAKGEKGVLGPHQDWNIVDESTFRSYNIWVPLVDVNPGNGTIQVLPQSHNKRELYRSANIPSAFSRVQEQVWESIVPLEMKTGEALIYDHALVHASEQNQVEELRLACIVSITSEQAPLRYFFKQGEVLQTYEASIEFYLTGNPNNGPDQLKLLTEQAWEFPEFSTDNFHKYFLNGLNPVISKKTSPVSNKPNLLQKILHSIGLKS